MTFIEFLGMIISLLALAILSARKASEERKRRANPELYEQEQNRRQASLREALRSMNIELEEERGEPIEEIEEEPEEPSTLAPLNQPVERLKTSRRLVKGGYRLNYKLDQFKQVRAIDQRKLVSALDSRRIGRQVVSSDMVPDTYIDAYAGRESKKQRSRAQELVAGLSSPRDMVILHEIIGRPKGLQR